MRRQQGKDLPLFSLWSLVISLLHSVYFVLLCNGIVKVWHTGLRVRGWSLRPPLSLDESVLQKNVPLIPSPLPASLWPWCDNSTGLSTTECSGAGIFPGLLFFTCPLWAFADREHLCKVEIGHGGIWAGFFSCSLQLFLESPQQHRWHQCFLRCWQLREGAMISAMLSAYSFCLSKYRYTQLSLAWAYCVLQYIQRYDGCRTAVTSQTPQMVCSVLLGAKLLWSVVVGAAAVPKSNPSQSFFWVLLLGYLPGCAKMEIAEESTVR